MLVAAEDTNLQRGVHPTFRPRASAFPVLDARNIAHALSLMAREYGPVAAS